MRELDLGTKSKINVKVNGESYQMRFPTVIEAKNFKIYVDDKENDEFDAFIMLLAKLGMPKEVSEDLETDQVTQLAEGLMGAKKK